LFNVKLAVLRLFYLTDGKRQASSTSVILIDCCLTSGQQYFGNSNWLLFKRQASSTSTIFVDCC